jgi:hypothetical protein
MRHTNTYDGAVAANRAHYRIDIEVVSPTTWRVWFRGKVLIQNSRTPVFESCRRILAIGCIGKLEMYSRGSDQLRLTADIVAGAGRSLGETDAGGLRVRPYRPFPGRRGNKRAA